MANWRGPSYAQGAATPASCGHTVFPHLPTFPEKLRTWNFKWKILTWLVLSTKLKKKIQGIQVQQNTWVDLIWPPGFRFATSALQDLKWKASMVITDDWYHQKTLFLSAASSWTAAVSLPLFPQRNLIWLWMYLKCFDCFFTFHGVLRERQASC